MTENQATINTTHPKTKKVSIQERSVLVGDIIVVNGHGVNRTLLKQRFAEGGYQAQETPHFMLFTRSEVPKTILVHWFAPEEMNADIKHYVVYELQPLGIITQSSDFGKVLSGVVGSFFPKDAHFAWHEFGAKTLQRFLLFLSTARSPPCSISMRLLVFSPIGINVCASYALVSPFSTLVVSPVSCPWSSQSAFRSWNASWG